MIHLGNISRTFNRGSANELKALDDISIDIPEGEFIIIVGANGSGKTTLLNILAGNIRPDTGKFRIDELDITALHEYERSRWIARIFQNPLLGTAPDLTILDNFRLASLRTKTKGFVIGTRLPFRKKVQEKVAGLNLGLEDKLDQLMGTLSGGQRQALALIMATMDETKILLLDEPAAALDPRTSVILMQLANKIIRELNMTAILVTHQLKDIINYGDRVIQLGEGKIVRDLAKIEKKSLKFNDLIAWFDE